MSASLVGSEMCIRDSVMARFSLKLSGGSCCTALAPDISLTTLALVLEAVSYTHLTLPTICSV
eukprot:1319289-Alexandrium_andersonii.AAC.1